MYSRLHERDSWGRETARRETCTHMGYVWISVCSVFEGLQIIYSPFRRRELFSFDRFIRRRSAPCAIAPRNIDDAYIHGPSRLFFFLSFPFTILFLPLGRATDLGFVCSPVAPRFSLSLCGRGFKK